jgi:hypothetical protein
MLAWVQVWKEVLIQQELEKKGHVMLLLLAEIPM